MIELPDFAPLRATASVDSPTRSLLDRLDHLLVVIANSRRRNALVRLPCGQQLSALLASSARTRDDFASSRADNRRATGLTVGAFDATDV